MFESATYKLSMQDNGDWKMGYTFNPDERIANILFVLDELQSRLHDSEPPYRQHWEGAITSALIELQTAYVAMRPPEAK